MGRDKNISRRRDPSQERSREMVEWIVEAAMRLFSEQGYKATTTNKIAELAGVSVGSLYHYFPNKESILLELGVRHRKRVYGEIISLLKHDSGDDLEAVLKKVIFQIIRLHRERPLLLEAITNHTRVDKYLDAMDREYDLKFWRTVGGIIERKYRSSRPSLKAESLRDAWIMLGKSGKEIIHNIAVDDLYGSDEKITDDLVRVILSYLDKQ
jgi:AcrR family transcriptional regulator